MVATLLFVRYTSSVTEVRILLACFSRFVIWCSFCSLMGQMMERQICNPPGSVSSLLSLPMVWPIPQHILIQRIIWRNVTGLLKAFVSRNVQVLTLEFKVGNCTEKHVPHKIDLNVEVTDTETLENLLFIQSLIRWVGIITHDFARWTLKARNFFALDYFICI